MQSILHALNSISPDAWGVVVQTLVSALIVSPLFVGIKKWFQVDGEKKMLFLVMLGSMGAAAVAYMLTVPQFAPWIILAQGWLVFATTQPVYMYFVKPVFKNLGSWFTGKLAEAAAINEAKGAAVPATGLPISSVPASTEDFSH
jgi:Na+/melibiose symporter-like transporter